jgi:hypothetical protein
LVEPKLGYIEIINEIIKNQKEKFYARLKLKHCLKKILLPTKDRDSTQEMHEFLVSKNVNNSEKVIAIVQDLNDASADLIIVCENVLCTMSLGYLKEHLSSLIKPSECIPKEKSIAVSKLGYGAVNKV